MAPVAVMSAARSQSHPAAANCLNWESDLHLREASVDQQNSWQTCRRKAREGGWRKGWDRMIVGEKRQRDGDSLNDHIVLTFWSMTTAYIVLSLTSFLFLCTHAWLHTGFVDPKKASNAPLKWEFTSDGKEEAKQIKKRASDMRRGRLAVTSCF